MNALGLLSARRIVPVVVIEDVETALPLAETLLAAGLDALEITLRTDCALAAIERVATGLPAMLTGAGSVRNASQLVDATAAGARFIVSPGSSDALLAAAADIPLVPGAATATEVMRLLDEGYSLQKFFPAELAGGVAALRALGAPLPDVRFFPTGGITAALAGAYLALPNVQCIGGSWIAPPKLLAAGDYRAVGDLAAAAAAIGAVTAEDRGNDD